MRRPNALRYWYPVPPLSHSRANLYGNQGGPNVKADARLSAKFVAAQNVHQAGVLVTRAADSQP